MRLNSPQIAQFAEEGYLLLRGALADTALDPIIAEYEAHVDGRAEGVLAAGKISQLYADEPFDRRLISICRENDEIYKYFFFCPAENIHFTNVFEAFWGPFLFGQLYRPWSLTRKLF